MRRHSDTATIPYPIRASIVTPASSLARGDWGLKRPLPSKMTSDKSNRPVVRVISMDTFEHVTDFESAGDHSVTLEKFLELGLPISLPSRVNYSSSLIPRHDSPFETEYDNTAQNRALLLKRREQLEDGAGGDGAGDLRSHENAEEAIEHLDRDLASMRQYKYAGPWLAGQTNLEFNKYLNRVGRKAEILRSELRKRFEKKRVEETRKRAQDNGEDIEEALQQTLANLDAEYERYIKSLRADPSALGLVIYDLLDLPTNPPMPSARISSQYFASPPTRFSSAVYAYTGPPKTHPSAGLSYIRTHAAMSNHPQFGPQAQKRPVEARILRPRGRYRGRSGKAIAGIAGFTVEDTNSLAFVDQGAPLGLSSFDATIPGGGKYWASPVRAFMEPQGRLRLASFRASSGSMTAHKVENYGAESRDVRYQQPLFVGKVADADGTEPKPDYSDLARSLMGTIRGTMNRKD